MWDQWDANWKLDETYILIHQLQPGALIGSNHHKSPFPGEDFQMFERDLPGENTMGFNQTGIISEFPLEMCETVNEWLTKYGETIYNTRKGPIKPGHWGATTQNEKFIYLHVLDLDDENLLLLNLDQNIKSAIFFDDGSTVKYKTTDFGTLIEIPFKKRQKVDTIIKLTI